MPKMIDLLLEDFVFSKRKKTNKFSCICYIHNKPCHNLEESELNCYFCYCPAYPKNEDLCTIEGNKGKYIDIGAKKVWDCSNCTINHKKEFIEKYLSE